MKKTMDTWVMKVTLDIAKLVLEETELVSFGHGLEKGEDNCLWRGRRGKIGGMQSAANLFQELHLKLLASAPFTVFPTPTNPVNTVTGTLPPLLMVLVVLPGRSIGEKLLICWVAVQEECTGLAKDGEGLISSPRCGGLASIFFLQSAQQPRAKGVSRPVCLFLFGACCHQSTPFPGRCPLTPISLSHCALAFCTPFDHSPLTHPNPVLSFLATLIVTPSPNPQDSLHSSTTSSYISHDPD